MAEGRRRRTVDWDALKLRLTALGAASEKAEARSPERDLEVLRERARQLAQLPQRHSEAVGALVVVFELADEHYGIEARYVHRIVRLSRITLLPHAPRSIPGIFNLHGSVLPVLDLRPLLGIMDRGTTSAMRGIVIGRDEPDAIVLTDSAHELATVSPDVVKPAPQSSGSSRSNLIRGIFAGRIVVLDAELLLDDERLVITPAVDRQKWGQEGAT